MADHTPSTPPPQRPPTVKAAPEPPGTPTPRTDPMSPAGPSTPRPSTPGSASANVTANANATPNILRRGLPATASTAQPRTPFAPRTPRTPSSSTCQICTTDVSLFRNVNIHTAKCTECDKRNKAVMRRCPGCTFQVCTPCFEKRAKEGRGLRHGIAMSASASPATVRTERVRVASSSGDVGGSGVKKMGDLCQDVIVEPEKGKDRSKQDVATNKRGLKKQKKSARFVDSDSDSERSSLGYDPEDNGTPARSKRRRSALTMDRSSPEFALPKHAAKRRLGPSSGSAYLGPSPPVQEDAEDALDSAGAQLSKMPFEDLLRACGVNSYDEHPLSRRVPVMSNPASRIPDKVKRGFKSRVSAKDFQRKIQEKVLRKMQERSRSASATVQDGSVQHPQVQRVSESTPEMALQLNDRKPEAPTNDNAYTVRMFVETEAVKYRDDVIMDEDENKALTGLLEAEALSWGTKTFRGLTPYEQSLMRSGLNVRLDLLPNPESSKCELANLLLELAAEKVWKMQEDRAYQDA